MARNFNGTDQYFTLADDAALNLGDDIDDSGPFSISFWVRWAAMPDSAWHYLASWGAWFDYPCMNIYTFGDNHATRAGRVRCYVKNPVSGSWGLYTDTAMNDDNWHHIVFVFDGTTMRAWVDGSLETTTQPMYAMDELNVSGPWHFGQETGGTNRFSGGLAEWAKWDLELSTEQITALAAGARPPEVGTRPSWHVPMLGNLAEEIGGIAVTNYGSTVSSHPPRIVLPSGPAVVRFDTTGRPWYYNLQQQVAM